MWRIVLFLLAVLMIALFGFSLIDAAPNGDVAASAVLLPASADNSAYTRALEAREWDFPRDHGAHPDFQTEWWYYTGNVVTAEGRRFGFQFTVFRRAIRPSNLNSESEWRSNQIYMAHFTVTDVEGVQFYHAERYSRGGADLAGAEHDPRYRVWVDDWQVLALDDQAQQIRISADAGDFAVHLTLDPSKPPALQGAELNGLSAKSETAGNASYYYSLTRLLTEGDLRVGDQTFSVTGTAWMDHEFSTSALEEGAQGWDWFGLQLDDGREIMLGQIRMIDGARDPFFGGLLVEADGSTRYLAAQDFTITPTAFWTSPHTGATYPSGWEIVIALEDGTALTFALTPLLEDQELHSGAIAYWEGAVQISGDVTGYGYAELTGYTESMTGRF